MFTTSGVEAFSVDEEFVCAEWCSECNDEGEFCDNIFTQEITVGPDNSSGDTVVCDKCQHKWTRY